MNTAKPTIEYSASEAIDEIESITGTGGRVDAGEAMRILDNHGILYDEDSIESITDDLGMTYSDEIIKLIYRHEDYGAPKKN